VVAAQLIFTQYRTSYSVYIENMQELSVAQIQELEHFVKLRHGYFDFNTFSFSIQKKITFNEFTKLLNSLKIKAVVKENIIKKTADNKKINFGKYKGMSYGELPDSYLLWLSKNYNGEDRNIITQELQNRSL